jgi:hypothetical protein
MPLTLSATALIDEAEAKKSPEIPDTIDSDYLISLIEAATGIVELLLTRPVIQRSFTVRQSGGMHGGRGGAKRIYLEQRPIVSLTSIQDDGSTPDALDVNDVILWQEEGILEYRYAAFPAPTDGLWNISFTAGEAANRVEAPWRYKEACRRLVAWLYQQPNPGLMREKLGETDLQYGGGMEDMVPKTIRMLLEDGSGIGI